MHLAFAAEAVMLLAGRTFVVIESLIEGKDGLTAWGWAPTCVLHVIVHIVLEHKIVVLLLKIP